MILKIFDIKFPTGRNRDRLDIKTSHLVGIFENCIWPISSLMCFNLEVVGCPRLFLETWWIKVVFYYIKALRGAQYSTRHKTQNIHETLLKKVLPVYKIKDTFFFLLSEAQPPTHTPPPLFLHQQEKTKTEQNQQLNHSVTLIHTWSRLNTSDGVILFLFVWHRQRDGKIEAQMRRGWVWNIRGPEAEPPGSKSILVRYTLSPVNHKGVLGMWPNGDERSLSYRKTEPVTSAHEETCFILLGGGDTPIRTSICTCSTLSNNVSLFYIPQKEVILPPS